MATTIVENGLHKIVKNVDENGYTAFCFYWEGPFRAIYSFQQNNEQTSANFTVWALDKATGIWGCFADAHDIGFDFFEAYSQELDKTLDAVAEKINDAVLGRFLALAESHINKLYFDNPVSRISEELLSGLTVAAPEESAQEE